MRRTEVIRCSAPGARQPVAGARQLTGGRQGASGLRVSAPEAEREGYFACSGQGWWWRRAWGRFASRVVTERR